jgi:hypothetical protein
MSRKASILLAETYRPSTLRMASVKQSCSIIARASLPWATCAAKLVLHFRASPA